MGNPQQDENLMREHLAERQYCLTQVDLALG